MLTYHEPAQDEIFDYGVSGDSTWRKEVIHPRVEEPLLCLPSLVKDCKECTVW